MSLGEIREVKEEEPSNPCPVIPPTQKQSSNRKSQWIKGLLLLILVGGATVLVWMSGLKDWMDPERIKGLLEGWGSLAPLFYMGIMALAVIISPIPSLPLDAAAGAVFGPFMGTVYSVLGAEAGALVSFFIARALGREALTRFLKSDVGFCQRCSERNLIIVILFARLVPAFSFDLVSYGAGLTRISIRGFALATFLGMIPPTFLLNYFGSGIFSGSRVTLILGGLLVLLLLLLPKWLKRHNPWGLYDQLEIHPENGSSGDN